MNPLGPAVGDALMALTPWQQIVPGDAARGLTREHPARHPGTTGPPRTHNDEAKA